MADSTPLPPDLTEDSPEAREARREAAVVDGLIALFDGLFLGSENTILRRSPDEPIYLPADAEHPQARILFAHGFFQSALHEIAHWCVAGAERRQQVDFGYWYAPDGRTTEQQRVFEGVEVKPQALEWMFSVACGRRFRVSVDNLSGEPGDSSGFKRAVYEQVLRSLEGGLKPRPKALVEALIGRYRPGLELGAELFVLADLG